MKIYVAGRTNDIERVQRIQSLFTEKGHTITFDWTGPDGEINKQWRNDPETRARGQYLANRERTAVRSADLVVLCWKDNEPGTSFHSPRPGMVGALLEVGIALGAEALIDVWILNPSRDSVFFCLPEVTCFDSEDSLKEAVS